MSPDTNSATSPLERFDHVLNQKFDKGESELGQVWAESRR